MPTTRRIPTLVAFVHCMEATAQDEVLEVLEMLLRDLFGEAITADQKARLRTLKDLDQSAAALAEACYLLLDPDVPDESLRKKGSRKFHEQHWKTLLSGCRLIRLWSGDSIASLNVRLDFNIDAISWGNSSSVKAGRFTTVSIRALECKEGRGLLKVEQLHALPDWG